MKVIILAAGQGERLRPLTENIPKCMVDFFGKSLLERQIDIFKKCGITDIVVVTGYCDDKIQLPDITKIKNEKFMTTNMLESLFTAQEKFDDSIIVSYGDIVFEIEVVQNLINSIYDISVVIDKNWKELWKVRFDNPLDDAESLILDENGLILDIGQKTTRIEDIQGQYIGLMKFQNNGIKHIKEFYSKIKELSSLGSNPLNPNIPFEKSYMTDFLQGLIHSGYKLNSIPTKNKWLEIDSFHDYNLYKKMNSEKVLKKFVSFEDYS